MIMQRINYFSTLNLHRSFVFNLLSLIYVPIFISMPLKASSLFLYFVLGWVGETFDIFWLKSIKVLFLIHWSGRVVSDLIISFFWQFLFQHSQNNGFLIKCNSCKVLWISIEEFNLQRRLEGKITDGLK